MPAVITLLIPLFLMILLGYILKYFNIVHVEFWPALEKITYFVFFPALLIHQLSQTPLHDLNALPLAIVFALAVCLSAGLLLLLRRFLPISEVVFGSLFQGSIRFNSYLGVAVALSLHSTLGLLVSAVALIAMIPLINVWCVFVLARGNGKQKMTATAFGMVLLKNPLIIGCFIGISLNFLSWELPLFIKPLFHILGQATLPLGLLAVGAALQLTAIQNNSWILLLSLILKLLLFPVLVWLLCKWLNITEVMRDIAVMFAALPTATSAYILARQMKGDYVLMANIITAQTLSAMLTMPIIMMLLASHAN
jgi:malonate transporter and related proteins